ncbi:TRAP transporter solute receptor, TAXI family [Alkaliphilus metalliredigens QYMF]|uniref:TRAP transporter solute receptor, TAXI family n=1 Tax=Alkaliphilus metalliredigens (strain QYMF) TaxID=293826 RepID=A6TLD6_ALKMQ|nr:TAXI family TRAP transporter solute-binding subunit [Alkaliphilus metalliredigens]ABR47004.1 TRAP transporter solute receptor, TAXI family [Alkaliphilus metalliredigens QYMF]
MRKLIAVLLVTLLMLVGCGQQSTGGNEGQPEENSNQFVTVATGPTSGVYYPIGGAISNIVQHELGYRSSVQSTGASVENINLLLNNRAELAITMADAVLQAYQGFGAFEDQEPKEELRGIMSLYPNYVQLVTLKSTGIETFEDLVGRRVGVGAPNSGVELNARLMFEAHGMTYDDIRPDYLNYGEAIDQIRNGMIEAAFVTSGIPNSTVMDLGTTNEIKIIPIEGEGMEYLQEHYPFFSATVIPAGTYDNTEDINTGAIMNLLLVNGSLEEEDVYNMTKGLFDHMDMIHNSHNAAKENINLESALDGMVVPLHPGAERYFREVGAIQ